MNVNKNKLNKNQNQNNDDKSSQKPKVFRDPLYGYIYFDTKYDPKGILKKLINTKCMQRLRRIRQLSCVNIVFHGAEHSRFTHSLGVYELTRRFLEINSTIDRFNKIFTSEYKLLLLISALLHDIGHGAYSHIFENIFQTEHVEIGAQIVRKDKEIAKILDIYNDDLKINVARILDKKNDYLKEDLKNKNDAKIFPIIRQLLSSALDFDRLDYLSRDSFYTGVTYGYIETDMLIRSINIDPKGNKYQIVLSKNSVAAIESFAINRYHMYKQVYGHLKVRGYTVILEKIFLRIKYLLSEKKNVLNNFDIILQPLKKFILQHSEKMQKNNLDLSLNYIETYLEIDDFYINGLIIYLKDVNDEILRNLCFDFLNRHIWTYDDNKPTVYNKSTEEEKKYYFYHDKNPKLPYKKNFQEDAKDIGEILIQSSNKETSKLKKESSLLKKLIKEEKNNNVNNKFFYRNYKEK
ncbi:MAG: HD domain-containing protein [Vigna little leaf phytoplasma]|nr:HD domain-containing protein [Vigna little leaf phytoplasma]